MAEIVISTMLMLGTSAAIILAGYHREADMRQYYILKGRDDLAKQDLERMAKTDALTGLGNRTSLSDFLLEFYNNRVAQPLSVLMIDVDYFKKYNDLYGHMRGDLCLRRVAEAVTSMLSSDARCYRLGGEEFLVVLPRTELSEACWHAEEIHRALAARRIRHVGNPPNGLVTVSIGVATILSAVAEPPSIRWERLIGEADAALYVAKRGGRNRTALCEDCHAPAAEPAGLTIPGTTGLSL